MPFVEKGIEYHNQALLARKQTLSPKASVIQRRLLTWCPPSAERLLPIDI